MKKLKDAFVLIGILALVGYFAFSMLTSDLKHIEDTNGSDNYTLQQITDANIIKMDVGALNLREESTSLPIMTEYKSKKYTGVSEIYMTNMIGNRFDITLYNLWVESGNFKVVLVQNDEIVHEFKLNELSQSYTLENPKGTISLRIAGESANFKFSYDLI